MLERTDRQFLKAVDGVSFDIARGETFALVGESGSGKSTVARMVVGLLPPTGGDVTIDGVPMVGRASAQERQRLRRRIQMIFQDPYASLNPRWKVEDIVAEPIRAFRLIEGDKAIAGRVGELLSLVGLHPADGLKFPHEFSGGQRQRVAIARALASNAEFIVCDEPTSALDVSVQAQILNLMRDLQDQLRAHLPFHQPQSRGGPAHGDKDRRHVSGADRRDLGRPRAICRAETSLYPHASRCRP